MSRYGGGGMPWSTCDVCRSAPSLVYCRADAAFICGGCDARVHTANRLASRHERVWVCELCERAPAALACCADSAVLCTACDAEVHSANALSQRHYRVPISPLPFLAEEEKRHRYGDSESESWLLIDRRNNLFNDQDRVAEYRDPVGYNNDCNEIQNQEQQNKVSNCAAAGLGHRNSLSHSVSFTSMDVSLVPDKISTSHRSVKGSMELFSCPPPLPVASQFPMDREGKVLKYVSLVPDTTMTEISNSHHSAKGSMELFSCPPPLPEASQFPIDREAKLLKYREKRKSRKFEKTIRYASRKAYAETRQRNKGRFMRRSDAETAMEDQLLMSTLASSESSYGLVPSF
ncbi:zinc finger protein CONSTANS-LIKE 2-like [Zingiber officinale]|uniref:CONSTANS-like protein n=1 Tax=Zingiber officinale TaxID=94328 RepID=A0A8J5C5B8_ZINOF|nr:zinc finger protein CONSTANS-LIKE 2-like [Zingiber officinale]KAG6471513.1 hypothetical protein ZIOFF_068955 [Zingiber officinale]